MLRHLNILRSDFVLRALKIAAWVLAIAFVGCAPEGKGLADSDAAFRIPAIKEAADDRDPAAVDEFIAGLDSDDPAVRLYSFEALRRNTGQTFDYHYYEDAATRKPAIDRWKAWWSNGHKS